MVDRTTTGWLSNKRQNRRRLLKLAATSGLIPAAQVLAGGTPNSLRPQVGDVLVHAFGAMRHQPVSAAELIEGAPPITALPMSLPNRLVRDGSRFNQLMVMKLSPGRLSARCAKYAADGVMAYSAVCTHTGCAVENWNAAERHLICVCHESAFDVTDAARVVHGPAPKPLAMLPLEINDLMLTVAGKFSRRIGPEPQG